MKICVYGASSTNLHQSYISAVEEFGKLMAKSGHGLVFGAGNNGLMGAVARGVASAHGEIIGVVPSFFNVDGVLYPDCTEIIFTETMRERKKIMEEKADAFVAVPGGIGTFDEFFEILTLKQLGRHQKPVAILNVNGYYDNLVKLLEIAVSEGFMTEGTKALCGVFDDSKQLIDYLENYNLDEYNFSLLKKVE